MKMSGEFIRFGIVGVVNTAIDFGLFILLFWGLGLEPLVANALAYLLAVTNSFFLNHSWTFRIDNSAISLISYGRFVVFNSFGLFLATLAILFLSDFIRAELAKLLAVGLTLVWNFSTSKLFVFNQR
ncbi:MAG: GtrA family protein [Sedimenticola sp.]